MKQFSAAYANGLRKRAAEFILASGGEEELWAICEHLADDNPDAVIEAVMKPSGHWPKLPALVGCENSVIQN